MWKHLKLLRPLFRYLNKRNHVKVSYFLRSSLGPNISPNDQRQLKTWPRGRELQEVSNTVRKMTDVCSRWSVLWPVAALHLSVCKIDGQPLLTYVATTGLKAALPLWEKSGGSFSLFDKGGRRRVWFMLLFSRLVFKQCKYMNDLSIELETEEMMVENE